MSAKRAISHVFLQSHLFFSNDLCHLLQRILCSKIYIYLKFLPHVLRCMIHICVQVYGSASWFQQNYSSHKFLFLYVILLIIILKHNKNSKNKKICVIMKLIRVSKYSILLTLIILKSFLDQMTQLKIFSMIYDLSF